MIDSQDGQAEEPKLLDDGASKFPPTIEQTGEWQSVSSVLLGFGCYRFSEAGFVGAICWRKQSGSLGYRKRPGPCCRRSRDMTVILYCGPLSLIPFVMAMLTLGKERKPFQYLGPLATRIRPESLATQMAR